VVVRVAARIKVEYLRNLGIRTEIVCREALRGNRVRTSQRINPLREITDVPEFKLEHHRCDDDHFPRPFDRLHRTLANRGKLEAGL
jgi:hypothetical protein